MSGSGLELNKIIAAILLSSLIAMIVGTVSNILYKPKLEVDERGYQIEISEDDAVSTDKEPEPIDIEALMAAANAESGAKTIKKCIACHSLDQNGPNKVGPNLWGIFNAQRGKKPGFSYSKIMAGSGGIWDQEHLFAFLKKPGKYMPGTKMSFAGIKKPEDIADVIAFLRDKAS